MPERWQRRFRRVRSAVSTARAVAPARFRVPAGNSLAILGIIVTLGLAARMTMREAVIMAVVMALATVSYRFRPKRTAP